MSVLLDSVIIIDHFNGIEKAGSYVRAVHPQAAISMITRAEVLAGFTQNALQKEVLFFLNSFPNIALTSPLADLAAELRRQYRWKLPDAFQAAVANYHGLKLATRNTKDFDPTRFDFVSIPYRLS